jgi:hypothetical protein
MTTTTLQQANDVLRSAVKARMDATPADDPKLAGYSPLAGCQPAQECAAKVLTDAWQGESCCEGRKLYGHGGSETYAEWEPGFQGQQLRPGSAEFLAVLDELKQLHLRKTLDYGVDEDALSNIRLSADIVNMPAWAGCVLRMMDKMHRLKAYFRRGKVEFDGLSDTLRDIACYAVIAEVLRREEQEQ